MNAATAQRPVPLLRRWWTWVVIIAAVQTGLIFLLGAKHPAVPRAPFAMPPIFLSASEPSELAALNDPTLFALPHQRGFSGSAWTLAPKSGFTAADWDEPLRWLPLAPEKLGKGFKQFVADNTPAPFPVAEKLEPQITAPPATEFPLPTRSTLRVEGGRALLTNLELTSWPNTDVLTNTVARALVDAGGLVVSATLLESCGLPTADQRALELTRSAHFEPLPGGDKERLAHPLNGLSWVKMIFNWHTVAPPIAETFAP